MSFLNIMRSNNSFGQANLQKLLLLGIMFLCGTVFGQNHQNHPGIFYEITKAGSPDTSWIFGTYHLVNNDFLNDKFNVQRALQRCEGVIIEVNMENADMAMIQSKGMLKDKTLSQMLSSPFLDSLNTELKNTVGIGIMEINQQKPLNVMVMLSMIHLMKNNAILQQYQGVGLDMYFANNAKSAGKTVLALEKLEEQMDLLFNKMSDEEQLNQLQLFLRHKDVMVKMGDELLRSWFDNDLNTIYDIYRKMSSFTGDMDFLIKDRNIAWMQTIPTSIKAKSQFIAVGALHLPGENGLINQLRKQGYSIQPINL